MPLAVLSRPSYTPPAMSSYVVGRLSLRLRQPALAWPQLLTTLAWRVAIGFAGIAGVLLHPHGQRFAQFSLSRHEGWGRNPLTLALDASVRDDALWYARIAEHGYSYSTHHTSSIAFYPLYPLLTKAVSVVAGDVYVAGMLVSTACLLLTAPLFRAWMAERGWEYRASRSALLLLLFPGALFFAAMYSETLYLVLALGAFIAFEQRRWTQAAVCVFLIALSRPTGILLLPCLIVLLYQAGLQRTVRAWLPVLAGPAALGIFGLYQYLKFGTVFAAMRAAQVPPWSRGLSQALRDVTLHARPGLPSWYFAVLIVIGLLVLAAVPLVYRRFGAAYALFAALTVIVPAMSGLVSLERYVAVDFPVFAALGCTLTARACYGVMLVSACCLVLLTAGFAAGLVII